VVVSVAAVMVVVVVGINNTTEQSPSWEAKSPQLVTFLTFYGI
jgi:hypothetical protein